jgi:hypothetical protein
MEHTSIGSWHRLSSHPIPICPNTTRATGRRGRPRHGAAASSAAIVVLETTVSYQGPSPPACLHRRTLSGSCPQPLPPRLSKFLGAIRVAVTSQRHVNANGHVGISNTRTAAPLSGTKRCPTTRDLTDIRIQHSVRCCAACPLRTHPPSTAQAAGPSRARLKPMRLSKPLNNPVTDH